MPFIASFKQTLHFINAFLFFTLNRYIVPGLKTYFDYLVQFPLLSYCKLPYYFELGHPALFNWTIRHSRVALIPI